MSAAGGITPVGDGGLPQSRGGTSTFNLGGPHPHPGDIVLSGSGPKATAPVVTPERPPRLECEKELRRLERDEEKARQADADAGKDLENVRKRVVEGDARRSTRPAEYEKAVRDHASDRQLRKLEDALREDERSAGRDRILLKEATSRKRQTSEARSAIAARVGQVKAWLDEYEARDIRTKITAGREERNLARARRLVDLLEEIGREDVDGRRITGPGFKRPGPLCAEMRYLVLQEIRRRGLLRVQGPNCAADVEILSLVAPEYLKKVAGSPAPALGVSTSILNQAVR